MPSIAEPIRDAILTHAVDLLRVEAGQRKKVLAMLKKLEKSLVEDLIRSDPTGTQRTAYQQARLLALLKQTQDTIRTAYSGIYKEQQTDLRQLALFESEVARAAINDAIQVEIASVAVSRETLMALAKDTLIEGAPSRLWWSRQSVSLQRRFMDQIRQGVLRGEVLGELTRRVRGTQANGFTDGVLQASRREAQALVRTSIQAVTGAADLATYEANPDVVKGYQQISTLDSRTSVICLVYAGKKWDLEKRPVGHDLPFNQGTPRHWGCRSRILPWLKSWQELSRRNAMITGGRPTSITRYFEQRLRDRGWSEERIATAKQNARASMDGEVSADISFSEYLRMKEKQSAGFADKLLGPTRAKLWRSGKASLEDMLNFSGEKVLTLDQLKEKIAA